MFDNVQVSEQYTGPVLPRGRNSADNIHEVCFGYRGRLHGGRAREEAVHHESGGGATSAYVQ